MKKLTIVGVGMGSEELLTVSAKRAVNTSEILISTARAGEMFPDAMSMTVDEILKFLAKEADDSVCLLVTGDAGFFSISYNIMEKLKESWDIEIINGINSLQYFSAKLKLNYENIATINLHAKNASLLGKVSYNKRVFVLTDKTNNGGDICRLLCDGGLGNIKVYIGENLSYYNERIVTGTAMELRGEEFADLSVMIIENSNPADIYKNLRDEDFIRGTAPMTKEQVRSIALSKLSVEPTDIVYDIGAGAGSVSVAMARKAFDGVVYAIEKNPSALEILVKNKERHGAHNIKLIEGAAPLAIDDLPAPNAVFIGGSGGYLHEIVQCISQKNPAVKIAVTAASLEALNAITDIDGYEAEIICINVSLSKKGGTYQLMSAQHPVYVAFLQLQA